jgi:transposase
VARELGLCHETLRNWVRAAEPQWRQSPAEVGDADQALNVEKEAEIARLRAQVAELQVEKEILRKAAAHFAKE